MKHILLTLVLFATTHLLAHDFEVDGIYYNIISEEDKTVEVTCKGSFSTEYENEYSGAVIIPSKVKYENNSYSVTKIGYSAFSYNEEMTSISVPSSVRTIESLSFKGCSNLKEVIIEDSDDELSLGWGEYSKYGKSLFSDCLLEKVYLGRNLNYIDSYDYPWTLYPERYGYSAFYSQYVLKNITIGNHVTNINCWTFYGCSGITSISIPAGVTSISDAAFKSCSSLKTVVLPNTVTLISNSAYEGCSNLFTIVIPSSVTTIGKNAFPTVKKAFFLTNTKPSISTNAFKNCEVYYTANNDRYSEVSGEHIVYSLLSSMFEVEGIKYVPTSMNKRTCDMIDVNYSSDSINSIIGPTVKYTNSSGKQYDFKVENVSSFAAYKCSSFSNLKFGNIGDIKRYAFSGSIAQSIYVDSTVSLIGPYAFSGCTADESIDVLSNGDIDTFAFYQCDAAKTINVSNNGNIKSYAFSDCSAATSITVTNNGDILDYAFSGCMKNDDGKIYVLNKGVIGNNAFSKCIAATEITAANDSSIETSAFRECMQKNVGIISVSNKGNIADNAFMLCTKATSIDVNNEGNIGAFAFRGCFSATNIKVTNKVGNIGAFAFYNSMTDNKGSIDISNNGDIADYAFCDCFKAVDINVNNFGNIGIKAFNNCKSATNITITNSVGRIDNCAFSSSMSENEGVIIISSRGGIADSAFINCSKATLININNVGSIGKYAFKGCSNATEISLGDEVTALGSSCFSDCSSLKDVKISKNISSIGASCFANCSSMISVVFNHLIKNISSYAFYNCTNLASLSIPSNVSSISTGAFTRCPSIVDLTFEDCDSVISIDCVFESGKNLYLGRDIYYSMKNASPFSENKVLSKVTTNMNVTNVLDYEFYNCKNLKDVYLSDEVTKIGKYAFSGDVALESFEVGVSVNEIGAEAFSDCTGLIDFTSHAVVPASVGTESLDDINKLECTLHVPQGSEDLYMEADQWKEFYIEGDLSQRHKVIISVDQECIGMGTTIGTNGYNEGSEATIKAIPNELYRFVEWNDGNKENPRTIIVTDSINLTAKFAYKYYISTQPTANDISVELNEELTDVEYNWFVYKSGELAKHLDGESTNKVSGSALEIGYFYYCMISFPDGTILTSNEVQYSDINVINKVAADFVIAKINAIGEVVYADSCRTKIEEARKAYDKLTDDQKSLVTNEDVLSAAEEMFENLKIAEEKANADKAATDSVIAKINAIGEVVYTDSCRAKIEEARESYDNLTEDQKKLVSEAMLKVLTDAENNLAQLTKANDIESNNIDFLIYPNPTSSEFTVVVSEKTKATMEISNAFGQIIERRDIEGTTTINKMLVSGVYTITLKIQGEVIIKKLIVK